jgi:YHS domain-containing protein
MDVDQTTTPWKAKAGEREYFFCSDECRRAFEAEPARYDPELKTDPPFTVSHGFPAPRFGSAASGGLENEPVIERRRISRDN